MPDSSSQLPALSPKPRQRLRLTGVKLDVGKAYELRFTRGLSYAVIGKIFGCSAAVVQRVLVRFEKLIGNPQEVKAYDENRPQLLNAIEQRLVEDIGDETKRAKASLNNVAYALTQVSNLRRLEQGKATSHVAILALAAQQADKDDTGDTTGGSDTPDG